MNNLATTTYTTSRGDTVCSSLTVGEAVAICAASPSDFARSLADQHRQRGSLSDRQLPWLFKLAEEEANPPAPVASVAGLTGLVAMMHGAREHLKHPKVTICLDTLPEAIPVLQLAVAGDRAKHPGSINVTDGQGYGVGQWFGRIGTDGTWQPSRRTDPTVTQALVQWNEDPQGVAAEHGRATGHCCFCRRELSTSESLAVGYGPVCAERYGLPWGAKPPSSIEASDLQLEGWPEVLDWHGMTLRRGDGFMADAEDLGGYYYHQVGVLGGHTLTIFND